MANFGDILEKWESQKKTEMKKSSLPQDGQAWRYKKTEPSKKPETHKTQNAPSKKQTNAACNTNLFSQKRNPMNVWLQRYAVIDKDKVLEQEKEEERQTKREEIMRMPCEASIDLHGLTRDEAWIRLEAFIAECIRRGLRKVLIIHGKGNHSEEGPVLKQTVRLFIESNKRLGRFGFADKSLGGKGATWVLIREV